MIKTFTRQLLVATPTNKKGNHYKTVVLIVADDEKRGTFGLCINRPAPDRHCICGQCKQPPAPLFLGGPERISEQFFFIHDQQELANKKDKLFDGVYLSCPHVIEQFSEGTGKMVTGYCGWKPGELEKEIKLGWWLVDKDPDPKLILQHAPRRLWKDMTPRHLSVAFSEN